MPDPLLDAWWSTPPPLIEDRPLQHVAPPPPVTIGKGSVQRELPEPIGQHNLLERMALGLGRSMADSYTALGRWPTNWNDALQNWLTVMPGSGLLGSALTDPLFHGSPTRGLTMLRPSERGPLGPGVYSTPSRQIAEGYYAGPHGVIYELPPTSRDVFRGHGHRSDDEWVGFTQDRQRLIDAAEPDKRDAVADIVSRMWSSDGYPLYQRIRGLYGSDEAAQALFRRAGFQGISGLVDGPEVMLFGAQSLGGGGSEIK